MFTQAKGSTESLLAPEMAPTLHRQKDLPKVLEAPLGFGCSTWNCFSPAQPSFEGKLCVRVSAFSGAACPGHSVSSQDRQDHITLLLLAGCWGSSVYCGVRDWAAVPPSSSDSSTRGQPLGNEPNLLLEPNKLFIHFSLL